MFLSAAYAQDTRVVTEPVIPPSCFVLTAKLSALPGPRSLPAADEDSLDTNRIQKALDACPKGQAVELKADAAHNAFLSGPLDLRAGVTLRIDAKTTLFGSRDPRVYEVSPGSCGIVSQKGGGCRALINGMSIGSETNGGADSIRVTGLSIDGADNGLRIKSNSSKGGLVQDVVYRDVCIRNTRNPILMDSDYEHFGKGGGKVTLQGFDDKHRLGMTFDNVHLADTTIVAEYADLKFGENVAIAGACKDKFVPMPSW